MDRIRIKDKFFVPYITYDKLSAAFDRVAAQINADFENNEEPPIVLCVLNGSIMFTAELMKRFNFPCELSSVRLASYVGTTSTGVTKQILGLTTAIKNRDVIIVEDIVDTGKTIIDLHNIVEDAGARDVRVCTMLVKPDVYNQAIPLDYVAMEVENKFIVGFGLDYDQLGRNYKDIYILDK